MPELQFFDLTDAGLDALAAYESRTDSDPAGLRRPCDAGSSLGPAGAAEQRLPREQERRDRGESSASSSREGHDA